MFGGVDPFVEAIGFRVQGCRVWGLAMIVFGLPGGKSKLVTVYNYAHLLPSMKAQAHVQGEVESGGHQRFLPGMQWSHGAVLA